MIKLDCNNLLCPFQELHGQVASTRANFKNNISALNASLVDNRLDHQRVLQYMLSLAFMKLNTCRSTKYFMGPLSADSVSTAN